MLPRLQMFKTIFGQSINAEYYCKYGALKRT